MTFSELKRMQKQRVRRMALMWAVLGVAAGCVVGAYLGALNESRHLSKQKQIECELNALYGIGNSRGCPK